MTAFYEFLAQGYSRLGGNKPESMSSIVQRAVSMNDSGRNEAIDALTRLLERENETVVQLNRVSESTEKLSPSQSLPALGSDEYFTYYGDLLAAVSSLNSKQSIPSLVGAIESGYMPIGALARFGPAALPQLTVLAEQGAPVGRRSAVLALSEMLRLSPNLAEVERNQLKNALLKSIGSEDAFTRMNAIDGLAYLNDEVVIKILRAAAEDDPYVQYSMGVMLAFSRYDRKRKKLLRN